MNNEEIMKMWEEFKQLLLSTKRENIEKLIEWLDNSDFKECPGSTKFYHSYRGGLLKHSLEVYHNMKDFDEFIKFFGIPEDSVIIMALLHDICKVNCYVESLRNTKNENGEWIQVPYYTFDEIEPLGHSEKSIMLIYECGVQLTKLERACIRNHMGFSEKEDTGRVSLLFDKCPQSLVLYWADLESAYIQGNKNLMPKFRNKLLGETIKQSNLEVEKYIIYNDVKYEKAIEPYQTGRKVIPLILEDGTSVTVYEE